MPAYRPVCQNTTVTDLKNEGRQGPSYSVWFYPVVCPFEERSALQWVISEVVFSGEREKWGFDLKYEGSRSRSGGEHGKAVRSVRLWAAINRLAKYNSARIFLLT